VVQRDDVIQLVGAALGEINEVRAARDRIAVALDARLFGHNLDSLSAVTLVVGIDERVQDRYGVSINPVEALAIGPAESPLRTVGTLVDYTMAKIREGSG
jgi:acyl carrier protein